MSGNKLVSTISREIENLNEVIDLKVIQGIPYKREAKRHRLLLNMLHDVSGKISSNSYSFLSFLL
jgi:hypothetical protein